MRNRTLQVFLLTIFGVPLVLLCQNPSPHTACGTPVNGLQLCLSKSSNQERVFISFRNVSDADSALNLGIMLGNGMRQYPTALALVCRDQNGTNFRLQPLIGPAFVGGRIDPLVVPLPAGGSFSVAIPLTQFGIAKSGFDRPVTATARFEGKQLSDKGMISDMAGVRFMPFWTGTIDSNPVSFTGSKKLN